jgi:hypothetical protein
VLASPWVRLTHACVGVGVDGGWGYLNDANAGAFAYIAFCVVVLCFPNKPTVGLAECSCIVVGRVGFVGSFVVDAV